MKARAHRRCRSNPNLHSALSPAERVSGRKLEAGRYALSVKGGRYTLSGGEWFLEEVTGQPSRQRNPLRAIFDAGMAWHRHLDNHTPTGDCPFVVPVLVFPGMERGDALEETAGKAILICGTERLLECIIQRA